MSPRTADPVSNVERQTERHVYEHHRMKTTQFHFIGHPPACDPSNAPGDHLSDAPRAQGNACWPRTRTGRTDDSTQDAKKIPTTTQKKRGGARDKGNRDTKHRGEKDASRSKGVRQSTATPVEYSQRFNRKRGHMCSVAIRNATRERRPSLGIRQGATSKQHYPESILKRGWGMRQKGNPRTRIPAYSALT